MELRWDGGTARAVDRERPYVLFVGADWEQKGGPLILDAFRRARAAVPADVPADFARLAPHVTIRRGPAFALDVTLDNVDLGHSRSLL